MGAKMQNKIEKQIQKNTNNLPGLFTPVFRNATAIPCDLFRGACAAPCRFKV